MIEDTWHAFSTDTPDDEIRRIVAERDGCEPDDVQILRYGGCICARKRQQTDEESAE